MLSGQAQRLSTYAPGRAIGRHPCQSFEPTSGDQSLSVLLILVDRRFNATRLHTSSV
jgi:hypothetical protein